MSVLNHIQLSTSQLRIPVLRQLFSTAQIYSKKFKYQKDFETGIGATNAIIDGPDYTFLDGRPTPLKLKERRRKLEQIEIAKQILELRKEIQFAVERHEKMDTAEKQRQEEIIKSKLKEKGSQILKGN